MKIEFNPRGKNTIQQSLINIGWTYDIDYYNGYTIFKRVNSPNKQWTYTYGSFFGWFDNNGEKEYRTIKTNKSNYRKAYLDTDTKMLVFDDIIAINIGMMH